MDTRKDILKGLTELGGIEEQDEEFPLPDMDEPGDEDFMDDADPRDTNAWAEFETDDGRDIPQFDGGGDDDSQGDGRKRKAPSEEWKKAVQGAGRKKGRGSTPSSLVSKEKEPQKQRRFCEIVNTGSASNPTARHSSQNSRVSSRNDARRSGRGTATQSTVINESIVDDNIEDDDGDDGACDTSMEVHCTGQPVYRLAPLATLIPDYPEPASPDREYFLSAMDEMWSSPSPPIERPAFLYSPPCPDSPTLTNKKPHAQQTNSSFSLDSNSPVVRRSQRNQVNSQIVHQTFMDDGFLSQDEALDTVQNSSGEMLRGYGRRPGPITQDGKVTESMVVQDSLIYEEFDLTPSQPSFLEADAPAQQDPIPRIYQFSIAPPTAHELLSSFSEHGLPNVVHQKPYFSVESDVPSKTKVFGGKEFRLQSNGIRTMQQFKSDLDVDRSVFHGEGFRFWEPNQTPPSRIEAQEWLNQEVERTQGHLKSSTEASTQKRREQISQIEGPTQKNPFGSKNTPTKMAASIAVEKDFMDVLSLEVHCQTRAGLLPDPKVDQVLTVFYCWQTERDDLASNGWVPG